MIGTKGYATVLLVICIMLLGFACTDNILPPEETIPSPPEGLGRLVINSSTGSGARSVTLIPQISIDKYILTLLSFDGTALEPEDRLLDGAQDEVLLKPGEWTFRITGKSASGAALMESEATTVTLENGKTSSVSVTLKPSEGKGEISITLENDLYQVSLQFPVRCSIFKGFPTPVLIEENIEFNSLPCTLSRTNLNTGNDYIVKFYLTSAAHGNRVKESAVHVYNSIVTEGKLMLTDLYFGTGTKIANHEIVHELWQGRISETLIQNAKDKLHIGYGHTSHGSQITTGMTEMVQYANEGHLGNTVYSHDLFKHSPDGSDGTLHYNEGGVMNWKDLGEDWVNITKTYLSDPANSNINIIMWSWCGQVTDITKEEMISEYLTPMSQLELDYPNVVFIYMTGHLDGTGEAGNLNERNEQIRTYCKDNNKWLYDFADIESYDPDGAYYLNKAVNDECDYDSNGDGTRDSNWATIWEGNHIRGVDYFYCSPAHTRAVNGNMKAFAAWWLFAQVASQM